MSTLADIRTHVRTALRDLDSDAYRWTDTELDGHIARALGELSLADPLEASVTVTTTAGSPTLQTSALPNFLDLVSVEFPIDASPRRYAPFTRWGGVITLDLPSPPKGERARLRYLARHTLDATGSTFAKELDGVLAMGAAGFAALARAAFAIDRANTDESVPEAFRLWGEGRLRAFRAHLRDHARPRALSTRTLSRE